jgi:hypothetical protein
MARTEQQMGKFTFDELVLVKEDAPHPLLRGQKASVTMVFLPRDREGSYFQRFPPGVVYSIEYQDGESVDVHEDFLDRHASSPCRR